MRSPPARFSTTCGPLLSRAYCLNFREASRRALGARRIHIQAQFLSEALALTLIGGLVGIGLAYVVAVATDTLPMLGPLFEDTSGKGDIRLLISPATAAISASILLLVGILSGLAPAVRASHLDPAQALRYE